MVSQSVYTHFAYPILYFAKGYLVVPRLRYSLGYAFFMVWQRVRETSKEHGMKKTIVMICVIVVARFVFAESEVVNGVTWYYSTYQEYVKGLNRTYAAITSGTDRYSGDLTVPVSLGGYQVRKIVRSAFSSCPGLTGIILPDCVVTVESSAFSHCENLRSVRWSACALSLPSCVFSYCVNLSSIYIPEGVISIESEAFTGCSALSDVSLPKSMQSIGYESFYACKALSKVALPENLREIGKEAFFGCDNLNDISLDEANTSFEVQNRCVLSKYPKELVLVPANWNEVYIPSGISKIPQYMFGRKFKLTEVVIPEGVATIESDSFFCCTLLRKVTFPSTLTQIAISTPSSCSAFRECYKLKEFAFMGDVPLGVEACNLQSVAYVVFPREFGAQYQSILGKNGINSVGGYFQYQKPVVEIVSAAIRTNDPTILDVVYRVTSTKPMVKVRALAFKDGVRSFTNVVRSETFIEGTDINIGDAIAANVEHKLTWRVSSDWQIDLAKVKFEVLAVEEDLLPLELVTIPANGTNKAMEISWNAITEAQVFDALLWLYSDKTVGLTLSNGILKNGSVQIVSGTNISLANAVQYVLTKMGFSTLSGEALTYANTMTRLGLSPSGVRQYAYRWVEAQ